MKTKKFFIFIVTFVTMNSFAQNWQVTGNPPLPIGLQVTTAGKNFLGSDASNASWIKLGVQGSQDIFIDNLNIAPQILPNSTGGVPEGGHWIGLGRIFQSSVSGPGGVGFNPTLAPKAHLHIHGGNTSTNPNFTSGVRAWFQTGVLSTEESNGMYVGLKRLGPNSSFAVINWADDAFGTANTDFLSFNFTSGVLAGKTANLTDGMELGRFDPSAGTFGVGNFMIIGNSTEPVRRVEILDYDPTSVSKTNANAPQLRLTYTYNSNPALGIFTEYQVTNLGDLNINTQDNVTKTAPYNARFTGFHKINPGNTVDINSQLANATSNDPLVPASWPGGTGASGLRFTDLTSASTITPTTVTNGIDPTKVLSVDKNGDVVLVNPIGNSNSGISINPTTGAFQLGAPCTGATLNQFLQSFIATDSRINLNSKAFVFSDQAAGGTGRIGIGNISCNVNNTLELAADASSVYSPTGPNGASGLRFTFLNSTKTPIANPGTGVLSVDANGDVIYVPGGGGGLGLCSAPLASTNLAGDGRVGLNNFNLYFDGQGTSGNNVAIGVPCGTTLPAKLSVLQSSTNANSIAVGSRNVDLDGVALKVQAFGPASGNFTRVAGWFESPRISSPTGNDQVAIFVGRDMGTVDIGYGFPNTMNAGLLNVNGSLLTTAQFSVSDSTLKQSVTSIENSLSSILQLRPVTFLWDSIADSLMMGTHAGFISQEVERVIPQLVRKVGPGIKALAYTEMIPYVVKGIQQQQLSIDSLRNNSGSGLGNACGATQNPLANDHEIPMNGKIFNFTDAAGSTSQVIIGLPSCTTIPARLGATSDNLTTTAAFENTATGRVTNGLFASANNTNGSGIGVNADATSAGSTAIGVNATAQSSAASYNTGVNGRAGNGSVFSIAGNFDVSGSSSPLNIGHQTDIELTTPTSLNYGSQILVNTQGSENYGIYASASNAGINYAGYFNGDVYVNGGSNSGTGYLVASDAMFKTNVNPISNASAIIDQLQPKSFYFDTTNSYNMHFSNKKQYGLIAQDVQTVLPELVGASTKPAERDSLGHVVTPGVTYKNLNYDAFIALLIKSNQEMQSQLDSIKSVMASCCNNTSRISQNNSGQTSIDVELSNADIVVLNQNTPNPFAEQTTITYNIPKNTSAAQILFYDINGRNIKSIEITKKGAGQLNVYANDLTNGVYSYTLIVDGKIIDTKKMIKQQ